MTNATLVNKEMGLTLNTCRNCGHIGTNEEVAYEPAIMSRDWEHVKISDRKLRRKNK